MYEVFLTENFKQQLRDLPDFAKIQIFSALERIKTMQFKFLKK